MVPKDSGVKTSSVAEIRLRPIEYAVYTANLALYMRLKYGVFFVVQPYFGNSENKYKQQAGKHQLASKNDI
jgi:hypothetical protein